MSQTETGKQVNHVIFLGAGASASSGYPTGDKLRLRMSSQALFTRHVQKHCHLTDIAIGEFSRYWDEFIKNCKGSIQLFRKGGFGTVDEFSKLASRSDPKHLRLLQRICG